MKIIGTILIGLLLLSATPSGAHAAISEGMMAELFNGLADIIERNMGDPAGCIAKLETFISQNKTAFIEWKNTIESNTARAASAGPAAMPSQAEIAKMQSQMAASSGASAMSRWTESISRFAMKNPEYMDKVSAIMEEISPQFDDYR
ncbi:hypothetical protein ACFL5X_00225 [Candidatus Omnitrophota bacterium]